MRFQKPEIMETNNAPMLGPEPYLIIVDDDAEYLDQIINIYADLSLAQRIKMFGSVQSLMDFLQHLNDLSDFPSLIVLDYNLPLLNNNMILSVLKKDTRFHFIPVAIYSKGLYSEMEKELLLAGAIYCREKSKGREKIKQMLIEFLSLADLYHDSLPVYRESNDH
ncbi:MAG TPA: hypothetical protein VFQ58_08880 [Flavisolibacter sp.]|jgi:CheY-like chemotaxis protein|nr:hypothetical protein [Flavisolibacter sp.]